MSAEESPETGTEAKPEAQPEAKPRVRRRTVVLLALVVFAGAAAAALLYLRAHHLRSQSVLIHGAVIRRDTDSRKELPIEGVAVTAADGTAQATARSDANGYFSLSFPHILWPGRVVDLSFEHAGYEPLHLKLQGGIRLTTRQLYVAALEPLPQAQAETLSGKPSVVSNIRVRYTVNSESMVNIGSAVKTFQVVNHGNQPCNHQQPCSSNGNWKASAGSVSLDAGQGNEFRDVRVSCIAGPCPFTHIDSSGYVNGGRNITATATDWSDTATFLLEAEVYRDSITSNVRELYPVIFGQALHFTLPPTQEGVSIEAEIDGAPMVFPLGPDLYLSWATCNIHTNPGEDKATVYRCELKPGYRF